MLFALYIVFSVFLFFSPLCSCAGQALLGRIKFVSVTAFLLMKNVLRHSREKNVPKWFTGAIDKIMRVFLWNEGRILMEVVV